MSTNHEFSTGFPEAFPRFDLQFTFDDLDEPRTVTVFEDTGDIRTATRWITIGVDHAVPFDRIP